MAIFDDTLENHGPYKLLSLFLTIVILFLMPYISFQNDKYYTRNSDELVCKKIEEKEISESKAFLFYFQIFFYLSLIIFCQSLCSFLWTEWKTCNNTKLRTGNDFRYLEYFFYRVDYHFSHNPRAKAITVVFSALFLIAIGGFVWSFGTNLPFFESLWVAWTFVADPGTHSDSFGVIQRLVSLCLTLGGMVIFAVIIGIISEDISTSVDNLRKGKSRVIESNHTLILGQVIY